MPYYITGTLTFSTAANRTTARASMDLAVVGRQVWSGGAYAGGLTNVGTTGITVGYSAATEAEAVALHTSLMNAAAAVARTAGHLAVNWVG